MRAARFRTKITLQSRVETSDAMNEVVITYKDFKTVYASIKPLAGKEFTAAQLPQAEISHEIEIRWIPGVTTKHRIALGARFFDIVSVANLFERGRTLKMQCLERL